MMFVADADRAEDFLACRRRVSRRHSMTTRTRGGGFVLGVDDAHLVVGQVDVVDRRDSAACSALRSAPSSALTGPSPSATRCSTVLADVQLHRRLGDGLVAVGLQDDRRGSDRARRTAGSGRSPCGAAARSSPRRPRTGSRRFPGPALAPAPAAASPCRSRCRTSCRPWRRCCSRRTAR